MNLTDAQKTRRLPWAFGMIALNAVFANLVFWGPIPILFLADRGFSKTQVGLALSFLPMAGLVAPLLGPTVARLGYKRVYLAGWGARKLVAATLLLTPFVLTRWGQTAAAYYIMVVLAVFALCRATADTAYFPWTKDFVPDPIRGRFAAVEQLLFGGFAFVALSAASVILSRRPGLDGFMRCMAIGAGFSLGAWLCALMIPADRPAAASELVAQTAPRQAGVRATLDALKDRDFVLFLCGLGLMSLALIPVTGFLPLYAKEVIGLAEGKVVLLQNATLLGGLASSFLWGWVADRAGGKPVMLAGAGGSALAPLLWLTVPLHSSWSWGAAAALALLSGFAGPAWIIGSGRLLFIELMPQGKRLAYTSINYAWAGLTGAAGALISGRFLDSVQRLSSGALAGRGGYAILFLASGALALGCLIVLLRLQPARQRAGLPAPDSG